jgi:hypothetical protein
MNASAGRGSAQAQAAPEQPVGAARLQFDVVSAKPAPPGQHGGDVKPMPGYQGYTCDGAPLFGDMTAAAYGVTARQIEVTVEFPTPPRADNGPGIPPDRLIFRRCTRRSGSNSGCSLSVAARARWTTS